MGGVIPLVGSGLGHAILEGKPVLQKDILHSHRFIEDMKLLEDGIRCYVVLPLVARGKALGVVALGSRQAEAFDAETLVRLQPLIAHLALAFDNVHLLQRMRELSITPSAQAVAHEYRDFLDLMLVETGDLAGCVPRDGLQFEAAPVVMRNAEDRRRLAQHCLASLRRLSASGRPRAGH